MNEIQYETYIADEGMRILIIQCSASSRVISSANLSVRTSLDVRCMYLLHEPIQSVCITLVP